MVSGDCTFPVHFESSAISVVVFVVSYSLLMTKRNSNVGAPKGILKALQITQVTMWITHCLLLTAAVVQVIKFQIMLLNWPVTP